MSLYKWGGVCGRVCSERYILNSTVYAAVCELLCEVMCVIQVKYCNHLLAVDMAGVACTGLWCACGWKNVQRYGMGVRKGTVVSFVPTLFGCFLRIPSLYYVFSFVKCSLFQLFLLGRWGSRAINPRLVIGSDDS